MKSLSRNKNFIGTTGVRVNNILADFVTTSLVLFLDARDPASFNPFDPVYWYDLSGQGNHGTLSGNLSTTDDVDSNLSMLFDGTNDYIYTTNTYSSVSAYTITVWFKTTTASGKKLVGFENTRTGTGATQYDKTIYMGTDGKIRFGNYGGAANVIVSSMALNDGKLHCVTATYGGEGTTMRLYVDGYSDVTGTSSTFQNYTGYWRVGAYQWTAAWTGGAAGYYTGEIIAVMVHNAALTSTEINYNYATLNRTFLENKTDGFYKPNTPSSANLINFDLPSLYALYDMRDSYPGSGTTLYDLSGNSKHGTIAAGVTYDSSGFFNFNGSTTGYISLPLLTTSKVSLTMLALVEIPVTADGGGIFYNGNAGGCGFGIGATTFEDAGNNMIGLFQNIRWIDTNVNIGTGWMLIGMTMNASSVPTFWKNGVSIGTFTGTVPNTPATNACLGMDVPGSGRGFVGKIAWAAMFSSELAAYQMDYIYQDLRGRFAI